MTLLRSRVPLIREKRLGSISAFYDSSEKIINEIESDDVKQRIRTFSEDTFSDVISALEVISTIYDMAVIVHGPRGCSSAQLFSTPVETKSRWVVTNLNQRDSIMGSDVKLRESVLTVYRRHKPQLIFIVATPVVAINNDDIQSVVDELSEKLGVSIIPVYTNGFKSKLNTSGYDLVLHALAKYLITGVEERESGFINIITVTENHCEHEELHRLVDELGIIANFIPRLSDRRNIGEASKARATIAVNPDEGEYFGRAIEGGLGIPFVKKKVPVGITNTGEWLDAAAELGGKPEKADAVKKRNLQELNTLLEKVDIRGLSVYVNLKPAYAFEVSKVLEEYGAKVVGLTAPYIESLHKEQIEEFREKKPDAYLHVANGQIFEIANLLKKLKPDMYIGSNGQYDFAAELGIPVVATDELGILGYRGVYNLLKAVSKAAANKSFVSHLSERSEDRYLDSWHQKKANWFIKQEVK